MLRGGTAIGRRNAGQRFVYGGGALPPFTPASIANLFQWLDASDTSTIIQAGGNVSQWNDKSGNGRNPSQGTGASQPITASRTINGLNVLDFNGTSMVLLQPSGYYSLSNGNNTVFLVATADNAAMLNQNLISGFDGGSARHRIGINIGGVDNVNTSNSTSGVSSTLSVTTNTNPHAYTLYRSGATCQAGRDGAPLSATAVATSFMMTASAIGAFANGTTSFFDGAIAEMVVYNSALSTAEMNQVGTYLAAKWGFTWTNL